MKFLCVVSSRPGHIDFGGFGFVKLAQYLRSRGYVVEWATCSQEQIRKLQAFGQAAQLCPVIDGLWMRNFQPAPSSPDQDAQDAQEAIDKQHRLHLQSFFLFLQATKPDIILLDRGLVFGAVAADALGIPYIGMGTPGGYWELHPTGKSPGLRHDHPCFSAAERVSAGLPWMQTIPRTFWVNSPYLNICFLGKSFYPDIVDSAGPAAFVHHFTADTQPFARAGIGVSFGNTGPVRRLTHLLFHLVSDPQTPGPIHVFVGNNASLYADIDRHIRDDRLCLHSWVDFTDYFPALEYLIFFGGIGTLWQCLNTSLPMLVVPDRGDQTYNGGRVEQLRMGQYLPHEADAFPPPAALLGHSLSTYQAEIESFKDRGNFTDTLSTVVDKITNSF